jgi:predicted nuclease of predicted toxin-antitoxin system
LKFLIDQNLPVRLIDVIVAFDHEVEHVRLMGLATAGDREIWALAASRGAVVVSKDRDFLLLAQRSANRQPLVHLNLGNCSNDDLYAVVRRDWASVVARLIEGEVIVEVRP